MPPHYTWIVDADDDDEDYFPSEGDYLEHEDDDDHSEGVSRARLEWGDDPMDDDSQDEAELGFADLLHYAQAVADGTAPIQLSSGALPAALLQRLGSRAAAHTQDGWASKAKGRQVEADPKGVELLRSGEFGRVGGWRAGGTGKGGRKRPRDWNKTVTGWSPPRSETGHNLVPNDPGTIVARYPAVPYVGQYAGEDYSIFYTATQYFTLHLYSTTANIHNGSITRPRPPRSSPAAAPFRTSQLPSSPGANTEDEYSEEEEEEEEEDEEDEEDFIREQIFGGRRNSNEESSMKSIKRVQGVQGNWTVTDCDVDKKGQNMIYSSITPYVHMLRTDEFDTEHIELDFNSPGERHRYYGHGIWSIRFSADGQEIVAGASEGNIMVYDIEAQRRTLCVQGHIDDVNAVCFADQSSTNILVSGSDDAYLKIWDRRSLSSNIPSGVLPGATEGITYVSAKGDGRYVVANSKDQAARLFDLRMMRNWGEFGGEEDAAGKYGARGFDYRQMHYPRPEPRSHPKDCSVMTFTGHSVLRTLIRCHFSPVESTGQSYIYSGSSDGRIHIWSLDGRVAQVLDRSQSTPLHPTSSSSTFSDPSAPFPPLPAQSTSMSHRSHTVRDVAWHGFEPTLMSTCWDMDGGYRRGGSVAKHEWKGMGKGRGSVEDWRVRREEEGEEGEREREREGRREMRGLRRLYA
ncbi:hypothetical protein L202_07261 [Cryptococcus amylolentus CBS 6039]|uniref:Uncharacterized protein n=1 Tax=Cryptococcus amylolentus CBS 6039 TaxID=1295533 RepID=A0A1E3HE55_9TREE|nr:hypothetical protein L202_07261 [Cryptococcus amylolentus CBS 6039]ODN73721.1 hypothetical protein L202_07261 [Cryptococcus amylolentus CBS 6039]